MPSPATQPAPAPRPVPLARPRPAWSGRTAILHAQIRDALTASIAAGEPPPGSRLPTESELMARYGVSRTTVRHALADMTAAGLIVRHAGRGTFVAEPVIEQELRRLTGFVEDMEAIGMEASARVVSLAPVAADPHVARRLRLAAGEPVLRIERVRLANGQPISFDETYLVADIGRSIAEENLTLDPIFALMEQKYGVALGEAEYLVHAATAGRRVAGLLDLRPGAPIFLIERTTFSADGRAIDFERLHYRGDRVRYRMRLSR